MKKQYIFKKGKELRNLKYNLGYSYVLASSDYNLSVVDGGMDTNPRTIDDIGIFIDECVNEGAKKVFLCGLDQDAFNQVLKGIYGSVEILQIRNLQYNEKGYSDLGYLVLCKKLKEINIDFYNGKIKLWEMKGNPELNIVNIEGCGKILFQEGLKGCSASNLKIVRYGYAMPDTKQPVIKDFSLFATMPNLEVLELFTGKKKDKREDLLSLASLKNIKTIKLTKNYFTFNQFAWLSSKLPRVSGIGCIYYEKYNKQLWINCYGINGTRMAWEFKDWTGKMINKYLDKFNNLVLKYKDQEEPPIN